MGGGQKWALTRGDCRNDGSEVAARDGHHTCHWLTCLTMPIFLWILDREQKDARPGLACVS